MHANRMETKVKNPTVMNLQLDYGTLFCHGLRWHWGRYYVAGKVTSRSLGHYGLVEGNDAGVDVLRLLTSTALIILN